MADIVDRQTRSRMMASIRGKDTKPELALRRGLHALGFRYRLHVQGLVGRPDLVLARHRAVVFVHGCFWHRHEGCRFATSPATRAEFWSDKFAGNVARDANAQETLGAAGWRVAVAWECALRGASRQQAAIAAIAEWLRSDRPLLVVEDL
jgi:DNA mismatch endonuclease (patch repair protein)